ncbi:MAG: DUF4469 domain-containing protein, partial [Treponema sp.]|nr:DUF4469 domain-containing protein [Treponema sp.]
PDPKKHPLTFRVRINKILRELAGHISIVKDGEADPSGHITEFIDKDENAVNSIFVPGDGFIITGHKIKLAGDDPGVGVFFVPVNDPSKAVKATRIFENSSGKLIGICPDTGYQHSKIEIRTQYSGSTTVFLKSPRVITSRFTLEQA